MARLDPNDFLPFSCLWSRFILPEHIYSRGDLMFSGDIEGDQWWILDNLTSLQLLRTTSRLKREL